jgi:CBS domain containing-hemolysin-like protein
MDYTILISMLILLTFLSGFFASSETAFFSLSSTRIKTYKHSTDKTKRLIAELLAHPQDLLVTVFMLNTLVNILLQNVASSMFGPQAGWDLKIGVPFILTLLFGEIIPKYIGIQNNTFIANLTAKPLDIIQRVLKPVRALIVSITEPISRKMFFFLQKEKGISKEELEHVLKQSEELGVLKEDEAFLARGYLNLQNLSVREIHRPREDILFYNIEEPLSKLIYLLVDQQCSRIPVCKKSIDNILGIISAKQFFVQRDLILNPGDIIQFLSKPFFVPENTEATLLLRRFNEKNEEIALIVDEYGSICGLTTYEDLNEVVVGEIHDLRDQRKLYTMQSDKEIIASGKLELSIVNEIFKTSLRSEHNMITIGGFIIEKLGEIPKNGTRYETGGFLFQILEANPSRIRRVYIRKVK